MEGKKKERKKAPTITVLLNLIGYVKTLLMQAGQNQDFW
jgi:hypothetical protein